MKPDFSFLTQVDLDDDAASDAEATADMAAGRGVPHEEVAEWLATWGTSDSMPAPRRWFE
jgi:predicted transcriptional regulator